MFGYVGPERPELKVKHFALYRSVYCSLCETLRSFGFGAKALLNYDFTFAAMLCMSARGEEPEFYIGRCNTNPFIKERLIKKNSSLETAAAALLISSRHKLLDDLADEGFFKRAGAFLVLSFLIVPFKRASALLPDFDELAAEATASQRRFEESGEDNLDLACDPTARMLAGLFKEMAAGEEEARIMERLGYLIGRYVYLADAIDDLKEDIEKGRYNPIALRFRLNKASGEKEYAEAISEARAQLNHATGQAESCYRLLNISYFKEVLDNIIYLGLRARVQSLGGETKGREKHGQSLSGAGA
ncbi:MAG: DUF5685 family protein [Oscillospiraceae bacterium]|nr:DUF5685 family protein [Oscillospiraceae bacterium]